jgi:hypothetical protein
VHTLLRLPTGLFYAQGVKGECAVLRQKDGKRNALDKEALGEFET